MLLLLLACKAPGPADTDAPDSAVVDTTVVEVEEIGDAELPVLTLSHERGLYDQPFDLVIDAGDGRIRVTFDGSDPRTSAHAVEGDSPLSLRVDPAEQPAGWAAPAVIVRASAASPDGLVSRPVTHTYLFPGLVASLSPDGEAPGPGWPAPYRANGTNDPRQSMDYGIDPAVADDPRYAALFEPALRAIPSVSIVTELPALFDETTGIYENALEHGAEWERPASVELLDPSGRPEAQFQADAGLRIRGGWSRHPTCPKHAFRLFFRAEYGPSRLEFPLFGDEGVDSYDTFDLRTAQNYSWSFKGSEGRENTFLRDVFSRDAQLAMGQPSTRSVYYHLYLDGVYWGLYQVQERAEASFAVSWFGGEKDQWDVVKVNGDDPRGRVIEATDGNLDAWRRLYDLGEAGFDDAGRYAEAEALVNVDNLIDYMLVIFHTGNFDAPTGAFTDNKGANNFFALYNREQPGDGFMFFAHDAEHSMLPEAFPPGIGLQEDRVNLAARGDRYRMNVAGFDDFHPQWLHHRLTANADYRARFNQRVHTHLLGDGALTAGPNLARIQARERQIDLAIVAESARWGDAQTSRPRTRDDDWLPAVRRLEDDWVPYRDAVVLAQLQAAGLYTP